jgi:predicted GIY-YIG superfamily endonuclease
MITVYVLKSLAKEIYYTGMTADIDNRLKEHNAGKSKFTSAFTPWEIIYTEVWDDWKSARIREKYLKSSSGKKWMQKKLLE